MPNPKSCVRDTFSTCCSRVKTDSWRYLLMRISAYEQPSLFARCSASSAISGRDSGLCCPVLAWTFQGTWAAAPAHNRPVLLTNSRRETFMGEKEESSTFEDAFSSNGAIV